MSTHIKTYVTIRLYIHQLYNYTFLFQRIRAQDYSNYYEWPECAGVANDPAISSLADEYSYSQPSSSYINSPSTQELYYSQDALIGGLQYPPEWKKTSLPKTAPTESNKANSNTRSNTYTKEMPLEELINTFLGGHQSQTTGQIKHTVNPNSHHDPLCHDYMSNGGTPTYQHETASDINVPQPSYTAPQQEHSTYTAPQQEQSSYAAQQQHSSYTTLQQQLQNTHLFESSHQSPITENHSSNYHGYTDSNKANSNSRSNTNTREAQGHPPTNSESSISTKNIDFQQLVNHFMEMVNGQNPEQASIKQAAEANYHSTSPHQSHSNSQTSHQSQQPQQKAAHKKTTGSQSPISYTNVDHNLQQQHSESGSSVQHKQAVPNCPSLSDPNLAYTYDSYIPHDVNSQTFVTDTDKFDASTEYQHTQYNSAFNTVPQTSIQPYHTNEQTSYSSGISPDQALLNTDIANKCNAPLSHPPSSYINPNQYNKPQTYNTQTDPMLYNDKSTPPAKSNYITNTNTTPKNNIHLSQNTQQYTENLMSSHPTGTSQDHSHHQPTTWSQQLHNTQQTHIPSVTNNKQSTKNKHTPQDDILENINVINEFFGKRVSTNKPKQNTPPVANGMNNKQQNPQSQHKNSQQEMLFQQMVDDNFPQIIESLTKTPASTGKGGRHPNSKNGKRNLLQQIISDNLPGIMESLNKNNPQLQNKNGEIDLRQLQQLLQ